MSDDTELPAATSSGLRASDGSSAWCPGRLVENVSDHTSAIAYTSPGVQPRGHRERRPRRS